MGGKSKDTIEVDIRTTKEESIEKENEDHDEWDIDGLLEETGPCGA